VADKNNLNKVAAVRLQAAVRAIGAALPVGRFRFGVANSSGELLAESANDADGRIRFPEIILKAPGDYNYIVGALPASKDGWELAASKRPAIVRVRERLNGLIFATEYPEGFPDFIAVYRRDGEALSVFPKLIFTKPGKYEYVIKEIFKETGFTTGYISDESEFRLLVEVEEDSAGNFICSANYPNGFPVFKNIYRKYTLQSRDPENLVTSTPPPPLYEQPALRPKPRPRPPSVENVIYVYIWAENWVCGDRNPREDEFLFGLFDQYGNLLYEETNGRDGIVEFEARYERPGKYKYWMKELDAAYGFIRDERIWPVEVYVARDKWGWLRAVVHYPDGGPEFVNYRIRPFARG
jgi:pilin isopeptide linkage protein